MADRQWCIVPNCDDEVMVEQEVVLRVLNTAKAVPVMVPFCRGHGPEAGGSV